MDKVLEQKMIDSLFAAQSEAHADELSAPQVVPYSFGHAGQISNEQMRAITMVNDHLARGLTHTLGAWLRTQMHAMVAAKEQMTFAEFLSCVHEHSYVCVLRLEPMGGYGLLEVNLALALMMVDMLLGGRGEAGKQRAMTEIEASIFFSVVEIILREMNAAWESTGLVFHFEERESHERVLRLMPGDDRTLCLAFDMEMDGVHGMVNLCLPAVVLNAMHRRLMAVRESPRRGFEAWRTRVAELAADAMVKTVLRLPPVRLASGELRALEVGSVLELPLARYQPAEWYVEGVRLCAAVPVARGERRAALLQQLPMDASEGVAAVTEPQAQSGRSDEEVLNA